jgi:hypothetical protein
MTLSLNRRLYSFIDGIAVFSSPVSKVPHNRLRPCFHHTTRNCSVYTLESHMHTTHRVEVFFHITGVELASADQENVNRDLHCHGWASKQRRDRKIVVMLFWKSWISRRRVIHISFQPMHVMAFIILQKDVQQAEYLSNLCRHTVWVHVLETRIRPYM